MRLQWRSTPGRMSACWEVFPYTWVWVLQFLFEPWKSRAKRLRVLQKHLVHDQHCFLSDVGLSVGHLWRGQGTRVHILMFNNTLGYPGKTICERQTALSETGKHSLRLTSVMMSLAKSRARSGVTKQERPVRATPVSYMLGLLRSCGQKYRKGQQG